uniref:hypothetical protein n=1 Tax=Micromonospora sp. NBC_00855 TaxID=2975978 RepID=UPI002254B20A|nr:hypothetical protein OHB51_35380 [Micromonospora sp. NBC_00855]
MSDRDTLWDLLNDLLPEREIVRSDIARAMVDAIEAAGWRRRIAEPEAAQREPRGYVVGWEEAEGKVTIALDESEPNPGGGPDRFAYTDLGDARMFLAEISPEAPDTAFHVYELHEVSDCG